MRTSKLLPSFKLVSSAEHCALSCLCFVFNFFRVKIFCSFFSSLSARELVWRAQWQGIGHLIRKERNETDLLSIWRRRSRTHERRSAQRIWRSLKRSNIELGTHDRMTKILRNKKERLKQFLLLCSMAGRRKIPAIIKEIIVGRFLCCAQSELRIEIADLLYCLRL